MKVYLDLPAPLSFAMDRVVAALKVTAPGCGFEVVGTEEAAELVLLHVIGYDDGLTEAIARITAAGKRYAMIQYCVRTTQRPNVGDWLPLWRGAEGVWSYYDLQALATEDGIGDLAGLGVHWHLAPLGADAQVFRPYNVPRRALILTSGYVAATEGAVEAARAVLAVGGRMIHLGPRADVEPELVEALGGEAFAKLQIAFQHRIPDGILAQMLSRVQFVAGLRRGEGFELPAVEGLLCGARPIMFDQPHYRLWFDGLAEFVPEGTPEELTVTLAELFRAGARPVTEEERALVRARFDWRTSTLGFWRLLAARRPTRPPVGRGTATRTLAAAQAPAGAVPRGTGLAAGALSSPAQPDGARRRMLVVADAVVSTGFARSALAYVRGAQAAGWDVHVLGLNYHGDPHDWPCPVYPCAPGGDPWGIGRLPDLIGRLGPSVVVVQNDPWNLPRYMRAIGPNVPTVAVLAVDGKNVAKARELNGLAGVVFWTEFGLREARAGGYTGPAAVVPLGVDLQVYTPRDRAEMRRLTLGPHLRDAFIVGCANRNQPRKRLDLLISYFAQWVRERQRDDAYLYLHVAPTGDRGYNVRQLAKWHGIGSRLILQEPEIGFGVSESSLAAGYATWDVCAVTTQGEGWGLTVMEAMACGIPAIVPDWSALGEWTGDGAIRVPCSEIAVTPDFINVIGAVADRVDYVEALERLYSAHAERNAMGARAIDVVSADRYRWSSIGSAFAAAVDGFLVGPAVALTPAEAVAGR